MGSKKSDDEATRTSLSVRRMKARAPGKSAEELAQDDNYEPTLLSGKRVNPAAKQAAQPATGAAPEVSRGPFHEGAHMPRAKVGAPEILAGLKVRLRDAAAGKEATGLLVKRLAKDWLPLLRQAVEQGAGDGLDSWLNAILKLNSTGGIDVLLVELGVTFERMRVAENRAAAIEEAGYAIDAVQRALTMPRKASFKVLERELEGKLDVDELLKVVLASTSDLEKRLDELVPILSNLKGQFAQMGAAKPDGLYVNYTRLKAEHRVVEGEIGRRKTI